MIRGELALTTMGICKNMGGNVRRDIIIFAVNACAKSRDRLGAIGGDTGELGIGEVRHCLGIMLCDICLLLALNAREHIRSRTRP